MDAMGLRTSDVDTKFTAEELKIAEIRYVIINRYMKTLPKPVPIYIPTFSIIMKIFLRCVGRKLNPWDLAMIL